MIRRNALILLILLVFMSTTALGQLIDMGGYIIDDVSGNAWYTGLDDFWNMNYAEQEAAVENLNTGGGTFGMTNWRLALTSEINQMFSQWKNADAPLNYFSCTFSFFSGPYENYFWDARTLDHHRVLIKYTADELTGKYSFEDPVTSLFPDDIKTYQVSAWIVAESVTAVPEPSTMILFATGMFVFAGVVRKRNRLS